MNIPDKIYEKSHQIIFLSNTKIHYSEQVRRIIFEIRRKCYIRVYNVLVYSILDFIWSDIENE